MRHPRRNARPTHQSLFIIIVSACEVIQYKIWGNKSMQVNPVSKSISPLGYSLNTCSMPQLLLTGNVSWEARFKNCGMVDNCSAPNCDYYRIFGIAILENELYILDNYSTVIIHNIYTMRFKRRWKMPSHGQVEDLKECVTNKCLYIMKFSSSGNFEILRVDP